MSPFLSYSFAKANGIVLLESAEMAVFGHVANTSAEAILEARRSCASPIGLQLLTSSEFEAKLSSVYAVNAMSSSEFADDLDQSESVDSLIEGIPKTADLLADNDDAPVIRFINGLIAEAVKLRGSDIHIEPYETNLLVRVRIDGVLNEIHNLPAKFAAMLVSRIKVMARLDIAEKRIPQDGRISLAIGEKYIDVRVSTLPSQHGERVVLRLLDREHTRYDVADLGMINDDLTGFKSALEHPNGIILVTGPTGSGKTTTLYAGLSLLNDSHRNIMTVEDPIEYSMEGIGQTHVNAKVGMTFAAGLRAILRQDPDIVMVGEVRDMETAEIAVQASLTGHLVLTTVHTNSAVGALTRLRDMGIQPFLLASAVKTIVSQRLVRKLCGDCREAYQPDEATCNLLSTPQEKAPLLYKASGCGLCHQTGYMGRIGIYEMIHMDQTLQQMIHNDANEHEIAAYTNQNTSTLLQSGLALASTGATSLEEVLRVCRQDERPSHADI